MEIFDKKAMPQSPKSPISVTKNLLDVDPSARVGANKKLYHLFMALKLALRFQRLEFATFPIT